MDLSCCYLVKNCVKVRSKSVWKLCVVTAWPDEFPCHGRSGLGGRSLQLLISVSLAISLACSVACWNDPHSVFVSLNWRRSCWGEAGGREQLCKMLLVWFCCRESACALQVEGNFPIISEKLLLTGLADIFQWAWSVVFHPGFLSCMHAKLLILSTQC